jgi:recombination protein RecT
MATNENAVATREPNAIVVFRRELESRANEIKAALPSHINPEKFQRTVTTAVMQNPDLLKADRRSLLLACMKSAQDGLLPDGREAALVTFSTRVKEGGNWVSKQIVQYMPMVYGLRKKVLQARNPKTASPLVVALEVGVVYRGRMGTGGYFEYEVGHRAAAAHRVVLDIKAGRGDRRKYRRRLFSIATMANGQKSYEVMRRFEIDKVRQVSQTGAIGPR